MKANVALEQFGHQSIHGAARSRNELQDVGAILVGFQSALDGGDLAFDSLDAEDEFGLFFDGMHFFLDRSIPPYGIRTKADTEVAVAPGASESARWMEAVDVRR